MARATDSNEQPRRARDPMSRAAVRQMLWLGVGGTAVFIGLMAVLAWATALTGGGVTGGAPAIDFATKTITTSIRDEPPNLDSTRLTDTYSGMIVGHVIEGLLRYDEHNNLAPGVAERWDIRADGATFWLRENARWSDGKPVTAHDFVFAWRTVVDPANASQYAFIFYAIKNGEAVNNGELPREALGVRAVSDRELEIEFESPIAYFDKLVAFTTFLPIRQDFYESRNGRYAADAGDLLYNGPFKLTRWVHGASLRLEKNPYYWDRDSIELNAIDFAYITRDAVARLNLFQDGKLVDVDFIPGEALDQALQQRWPLGRYGDGSIWYLEFNFRDDRVTRNRHLRKALQLVNDPAELVYKVLQTPSYTVAESLFPSWLRGPSGLLRQQYPPPKVPYDVEAARRELELAKEELGLRQLPPIVMLSDDTPAAIRTSEYLQEQLRRTLGLEIRIDRQNFKQRLEKSTNGEFDVIFSGWGPDYDDPLTFGDLFASWNLNNHGKYSNPELDRQVRIAQRSIDPDVRMAAFGEIQRILIEDAVLVPYYERGVMYVQDARLTHVTRRAIGPFVDYTHARLVEHP
jgi:oligopeptide transport system substrate-binding protein